MEKVSIRKFWQTFRSLPILPRHRFKLLLDFKHEAFLKMCSEGCLLHLLNTKNFSAVSVRIIVHEKIQSDFFRLIESVGDSLKAYRTSGRLFTYFEVLYCQSPTFLPILFTIFISHLMKYLVPDKSCATEAFSLISKKSFALKVV